MPFDRWTGDARAAWRTALAQPGFTLLVVLTLALGFGAGAAVFAIADAVLVRPYPFRDQGRLAILWQADVARNHPFVEVSYLDARDWASRTPAFQSIAAMSAVNFSTTLTGLGEPRQIQVQVN